MNPPIVKALQKVFQNCIIKLDDAIISKEVIIQAYIDFLTYVSYKNDHNIGIILHTGSIIFDAVSVLWAAIHSLLANETSIDDIIKSLIPNESLVTYSKVGRCRFIGILQNNDSLCVKLLQEQEGKNATIYFVPATQWSQITPYQGKSKVLDGRGLRSAEAEKRKRFIKSVLGIKEADIPSLTDTSTVLVMTHEKANMFVKALSITYGCETYKLQDLVTASWFTDSEEYPYSGNAAKNEPVLRFTGSLSTGRRLVVKRGGNYIAGLFVCDDGELLRGETELPELLSRESLQYIYILASTGLEQGTKLVFENNKAEVFACTKDFLLSCSLKCQNRNQYTNSLYDQINAITEHKSSSITVNGFVDWNTLIEFRRAMFRIKGYGCDTSEMKTFMIDAWSLFNLLQNAVFPIQIMEKLAKNGKLTTKSPSLRLSELQSLATAFPSTLENTVFRILEILGNCYSDIQNQTGNDGKQITGKYFELLEIIRKRFDKRICIIVPKRYYQIILKESGIYDLMIDPNNLSIITSNQLERNEIYDTVVFVGELRGRRFDCFSFMSAKEVISLLYECETKQYESRKKAAVKTDRALSKRSSFHIDLDEYDIAEEKTNDEEIELLDRMSAEIDSFIEDLSTNLPSLSGITHELNSTNARETEIAAVVSFDTGEKAFLTPYYEACVFDESKSEVFEKRISEHDLFEGDLVVFTRNDNDMHDIVDDILNMLIRNGRLVEDECAAYRQSKAWKNKLRMYMRLSGLTAGMVAGRMHANGVSIASQTVRVWTDFDSHIVGPMNQECIRQIGLIVNDNSMAEHPEETMAACKRIRQRRRRILDVIQKSIRAKLSGQITDSNDTIEKEILSRIDSQADILRVVSFTRMKKTVLSTYVNKPINM